MRYASGWPFIYNKCLIKIIINQSIYQLIVQILSDPVPCFRINDLSRFNATHLKWFWDYLLWSWHVLFLSLNWELTIRRSHCCLFNIQLYLIIRIKSCFFWLIVLTFCLSRLHENVWNVTCDIFEPRCWNVWILIQWKRLAMRLDSREQLSGWFRHSASK